MANSVSGVGSRVSPGIQPPSAGGSGDRTRSQTVQPAREQTGVGPRDPNEREYVHWEGRRFDLNAPRGTYLNILV
jgi:hypothetical protein